MADGDFANSRRPADEGIRPAERPELVAFVADAASEAALREGLEEVTPNGLVTRRMNCAQAIVHLKRSPTPKTLIVDISGEEHPLDSLVSLSEVVEPDVRVLVIGDRQDINFYRQITRGLCVLEYLYKPLARAMVARHFGPWIGGTDSVADSVVGGRVISVTGTGGGAGATTIATNLAWHFAAEIRRHTLLLDPDLHTGNAALCFGVRGDTGLRTALEQPDRVDELLIERSAQSVSDRLSILSSEEKLSDKPEIAVNGPRHLLSTLRRRYNFVVVDAPLRSEQIFRDFLDLSHQRIHVMAPTLPGVREALRLLQMNVGPSQSRRPLLVVNQLGRPGTLTAAQIEKALGTQPHVTIPYLPRLVGSAVVKAQPAAAHRGPFRSGIITLGQEAAFVRLVDNAGEISSRREGMLKRLFRLGRPQS